MIILIIGGIGSGKTLSAVKEIIGSDNYAFTNFRINLPETRYHRLKFGDIMTDADDNKKAEVNWDFWDNVRKKHKYFSIFLDEAHNIINSRLSMSRRNITFSKWLSQIRKVTSDSVHNHLWLITQQLRMVDVNARELSQVLISCFSRFEKGQLWIYRSYYNGAYAFENGYPPLKKSRFKAAQYFDYYSTKDFIRFGDTEEYL